MSEQDQNQNSTSMDFDEELNDLLIRKYMLNKIYKQMIDDGELNELFSESVSNEIGAIDNAISEIEKETTDGS